MTHLKFKHETFEGSFNNMVDELFSGFPVVR